MAENLVEQYNQNVTRLASYPNGGFFFASIWTLSAIFFWKWHITDQTYYYTINNSPESWVLVNSSFLILIYSCYVLIADGLGSKSSFFKISILVLSPIFGPVGIDPSRLSRSRLLSQLVGSIPMIPPILPRSPGIENSLNAYRHSVKNVRTAFPILSFPFLEWCPVPVIA